MNKMKIAARKIVMEHGGYEEDTIGFLDLVEAIASFGEECSAAALIERMDCAFPGKFWLLGKGRVRPNEPLYGLRVFEPGDPDRVIAESEHDDLLECVRAAPHPTQQPPHAGEKL